MEIAPAKPRTLHWIALGLLVVSVCINYADRGNLGVAAKSIATELHFSPGSLGTLLGSFFITYAAFQLVSGKLIDTWNVNWVYAAGFLIWSAATGLTGLVSTFPALLCLRLVLGAGESVAYPAYSKILATVFPERLRGTANALIDAGSKVGPALGVMLGVDLLNRFTWRGMFVVIAAASFLWLIPWSFVAPRLEVRKFAKASAWAPSYAELLGKRAVWGTVLGLFGANYGWYFLLNWLPYYMETIRHYTHARLALMASLPFWAVAIASLLFGLFADALIRRGGEPGRVRQSIISLGLLCCCAFLLPAVLVKQAFLSNLFLILASVSMGGFSSNHWALTQRLSGAPAAGKWTGFENCLGNIAGFAASYVSGVALGLTHSFVLAFSIVCFSLLMSAVGYWIVIGNPLPVEWATTVTSEGEKTYIAKSAS
ncbi:MAG TPA: MFS transporter [Terriglobia bacterium]|nr:MFS transporter [Terriglobia bacterium]